MLWQRSSYVQHDLTAALTLTLQIPPFEYQPKYWTSTLGLWNIVSMTHWRFREEEAVSPQCLRTLSRVASFQSSTVSGPSLFRFGTKRFEGNELSSCLQFANFWFHSRCEMATSKGSPTRTSKVLCSKLLAPTFLPPISLAPQVQWDKILDKWNSCNSDPKKTLGIKLPYLVMIIKNMKKYFTFEVQVRSGWIKTAYLYNLFD